MNVVFSVCIARRLSEVILIIHQPVRKRVNRGGGSQRLYLLEDKYFAENINNKIQQYFPIIVFSKF